MSGQPDLFDTIPIERMVHRDAKLTEVDAARAVSSRLLAMHEDILAEFAVHGAMTDEQLERLPVFSNYGPSTVRKRRSELYQAGRLKESGKAVNSRGRTMMIWDLA